MILGLVFWLCSVPAVFGRHVNDHIVNQLVCKARHLNEWTGGSHATFLAECLDLLPARARIHADDWYRRSVTRPVVSSNPRDRYFNADRADIGAAKAVYPKRV